jgi:hypothetical protein
LNRGASTTSTRIRTSATATFSCITAISPIAVT